MHDDKCSCGLQGERIFSPSLMRVDGGTGNDMDRMDPGAIELVMDNKRWLESPEMQAKRADGRITVKDEGTARWARPEMAKTVY